MRHRRPARVLTPARGRARHAEDRRELAHRDAVEEVQLQHGALVGREARERGAERVAEGLAVAALEDAQLGQLGARVHLFAIAGGRAWHAAQDGRGGWSPFVRIGDRALRQLDANVNARLSRPIAAATSAGSPTSA